MAAAEAAAYRLPQPVQPSITIYATDLKPRKNSCRARRSVWWLYLKLAKANRFVALQTITMTRYDSHTGDLANLKSTY